MMSDSSFQQQQQQQQLSPDHHRALLLHELNVTLEHGLTSQEAAARRVHGVNTVDPPIQCPGWICCLLPCIKSIPSQKAFLQMRPDDTEVKRNGKWMRYDASSLVQSDIIRLEEGDVVPADCTVLVFNDDDDNNHDDFLVDHGPVTGDAKPAAYSELYWGGRVLVGSCVAVVTAVGNATKVGQLIRSGQFPATTNSSSSSNHEEDDDGGIALLPTGKDDDIV